MAKGAIDSRGLVELRGNFAKLEKAIEKAILEAVKESAESMKDDMQALVPVDTGRLRDSIRIEYSNKGKTALVGPGDEIEYADFVEYGTSHQAAQPYVQPALSKNRQNFPKIVERRIKKAIKSV